MTIQRWGAVLAVVAVAACSPAPIPVGSIDGKVEVQDGTLDGVFVSIGTEVKTPAADGTFSFPGLTPQAYKVTATKEGYVTATADAAVVKDQAAHVTLTLAPKAKPNQPPVLASFSVNPTLIARGGQAKVLAVATDPDGDAVTYTFAAGAGWTVTPGTEPGTATLTAPADADLSTELTVTVKDAHDASVGGKLLVGTSQDRAPVVASIVATPSVVAPLGTATIVVQSTDPDGEALTYTWHAPTGWTVEGSGATVTVTAPDAFDAKAVISVDVKDPAGATLTAAVGLATPRNGAPIFSSLTASPTPAAPGATVTLTASANDPEGEAVTFAWTAPEGWALSGAGAQVTLVAPADHGKQGLVQVTATDAHGKATSAQLAVSTTPNAPPMLSSLVATPPSLKPGQTATIQAIAADPDGETLSYTWRAPAGWTITGTGNEVTVAAPDAFGQTARISVEVGDGHGGTLTGALLLSTIVEGAPLISSVTAAPALVNPGGTLHVSASAQDVNGTNLTYTWTAPAGWTVNPEGNGATATVTAPGTYAQVASIGVTVSNGSKSTTASVVVGTALNHAPQVASLLANPNPLVKAGTAEVLASASDPDGDALTYTWTAPAGWTVSGTGAKVTLTAPDARGTSAVLRLDVSDTSGLQTTAQLLVATADNRPPQLSGITVTGSPADPSGTVQLHATAMDPDGDALTYDWNVPPGWTLSGSGADVTLTAPARTDVTASVFLAVSDPLGVAASGRVTVKTRANVPPTFSKLEATPNPAHSLANVTATATVTDPDPQVLAYTWSVDGGWTITGTGSTVTLKAPPTRGTTATLTATVDDGFGGKATKTAGLSTAANVEPTVAISTPSKLDLVPGSTLALAAAGDDADADTLTYAWTAPTGWTITGTGANVTLKATSAYAATGTVHVAVSDGFGGSAGADLDVGTRANTPPAIGSLTATPTSISAGGTIALAATVTDPDAQVLTYTWAAPAGWTITGTGANVSLKAPAQRGTSADVTLTVTDGAGGSDAKTVSVSTIANHDPVAAFVTSPQTSLTRAAHVALTLAASDADGDALSYAWTAPTGFTITGTGASVFLDAPNAYGRSGDVSVTVTDTVGASVSLILAVATKADAKPVLETLDATPPVVAEGGTLTLDAAAHDDDADDDLTYTWTVPAGWTLDGEGATVSLTAPPTRGATGTVKLVVDDGFGGTDEKSISVGTAANHVPTLTLDAAATTGLAPGDTVAVTALWDDTDGDTVTYDWTATGGFSVVGTGDIVSLEAPLAYAASGTLTLTIDDGFGGSASYSLPISTRANNAPIISALDAVPSETIEGDTIQLFATATDPEGSPVDYQWTVPTGWTLTGSGPAVTLGAPALRGETGTVTLVAADPFGAKSTRTVAVATRANHLPELVLAGDPTTGMDPASTAEVTASATDLDFDNLTYNWSATGGFAVVGTGETVQILAPTTFDASGMLHLEVSDGFGGTAVEERPLSTRPNAKPVIHLVDVVGLPVDAGGTLTVSADASDSDGQSLTYDWSVGTGWSIAGSGATITVTAPSQRDASTTLTLLVDDGFGGTATKTTSIATLHNEQPVIDTVEAAPSEAARGGTIDLAATATDGNDDTLTYTWTAPAGWTLSSTTGNAVQLTAPNAPGASAVVDVEVTDGFGGRVKGSVTVTTVPDHAPVLDDDAPTFAGVAGRAKFTGAVTASDEDGDAVTFALAAGAPAGAKLTSDGHFSWTPTRAQAGTHQIGAVANDGFSTTTFEFDVALAPYDLAASDASEVAGAKDVRVLDATGDGIADLVYVDGSGDLFLAAGLGDGTFDVPMSTVSTTGHFVSLAVADVDDDGQVDMLLGDSGGSVQLFRPNGSGDPEEIATVAGTIAEIVTADVDGDGTPDVVVRGSAGLDVLTNDGSGAFTGLATAFPVTCAGHLAIADFDQDGVNDVAVAHTCDTDIEVFPGTATGLDSTAWTVSLGAMDACGKALVAADFDGDAVPDLAVVSQCTGYVYYVHNGPTGLDDAPTYGATAPSPAAGLRNVAAADLDLDGKLDLVVADSRGGTGAHASFNVLFGRGALGFSAPTAIGSGTANTGAGVLAGDLDGDSVNDVAWFSTDEFVTFH